MAAAAAVALMQQAAELETSTPKHAVTPAPDLAGLRAPRRPLDGAEAAGKAIAAYRAIARALSKQGEELRGFSSAEQALRSGGSKSRKMRWQDDIDRSRSNALSELYRIAPLGDKDPDDLARPVCSANSMLKCFVFDEELLVGAGRAVAVHPDYQGQGLGKAIIAKAEGRFGKSP